MRKSEVKEIVKNRPRSFWEHQIDEWVHSEKDRKVLKSFLLDDISLTDLSNDEYADYSNFYKRYQKALKQLMKHCKI